LIGTGAIPGATNAGNASLWVDGNDLYLAYVDQIHGGRGAVTRYDGKNWVTLSNNFSEGPVDTVGITVDQGNPIVAFSDGSRQGKITVMTYSKGYWFPLGPKGFSAGLANYESVALDTVNHILYVAFRDSANGDQAAVMGYRLSKN
jgi:hypothetical protein